MVKAMSTLLRDKGEAYGEGDDGAVRDTWPVCPPLQSTPG